MGRKLLIKNINVEERNIKYLIKETNIKSYRLPQTYYLRAFKRIIHQFFVICEECKKRKAFQIHHIDKNKRNNEEDNLLFLCHICHHNIHHPQKKRTFNYNMR